MGDDSAHASAFSNFAMEEITGKVILIAIIALFIAVLFVLSLHLYAKIFWWRAEQLHPPGPLMMRRRRVHFVFPPEPDPSRARGLDTRVLRSIPVVVHKAQDFQGGLDCAVCLSELVDGEKVRILPKCNHGFHVDCVDMWFQSHSTCPLCRDIVSDNGSRMAETIVGHDASLSSSYSPLENRTSAPDYTENHDAMSVEVPGFPTNVLVWGNENEVSTGGAATSQQNSISGASPPYNGVSRTQDGDLAIEIPRYPSENSSSESTRTAGEDEAKPAVTTRLRSLKKLLSWEKRTVTSCSPSASNDVSIT